MKKEDLHFFNSVVFLKRIFSQEFTREVKKNNIIKPNSISSPKKKVSLKIFSHFRLNQRNMRILLFDIEKYADQKLDLVKILSKTIETAVKVSKRSSFKTFSKKCSSPLKFNF